VHVEAPDGSDAEHVVLTVTDSGIGIPAELLPRVFDLFTQDDRSRHHADGLGIGLALARRLIELHGGSIEGYSDGPALGSTFRMHLPRSTEAVTPGSATAPGGGAFADSATGRRDRRQRGRRRWRCRDS
jgi:signal transduction histidine kinase